MKKCNQCQLEKEIIMFDKVSKNGYRNTCRKCRNEKNYSAYIEREGNWEKRREWNRKYQNMIRENRLEYRVYRKALDEIKMTIQRIKKNKVGDVYTIMFKAHMENKFYDGMTWDNYGLLWEIDHIISAIKMARMGYSIGEINNIRNIRPLKITHNRGRNKIRSTKNNITNE